MGVIFGEGGRRRGLKVVRFGGWRDGRRLRRNSRSGYVVEGILDILS